MRHEGYEPSHHLTKTGRVLQYLDERRIRP